MADDVSNAALIAFYRGTGQDAAGRRIDEIWAWDARRLEMVHDYIQWLFPLPERSRFNPEAPCLTRAGAHVFRDDADLQVRLARSLDTMLAFYGLHRAGGEIVKSGAFAARSAVWLTPLNHNHLRLTRILLALGYLGRANDAQALFACLAAIAAHEGHNDVGARTLQFWTEAVRAPHPLI